MWIFNKQLSDHLLKVHNYKFFECIFTRENAFSETKHLGKGRDARGNPTPVMSEDYFVKER